ncbi:MAG: hypothetical protein MUE71_07940 [Chitinophagaceae bacterium]|nr:hypothetical protein [Chitinophagaceae bacterium]
MKKIYTVFLLLSAIWGGVHAQTVIPAADELILPQYAYYGGTNPANRIPFVCRLKLTGLNPSSTYRYFTGMSTNAAASAQTPGNMYRINNGASVQGFGHITGFAVTKAINSTEINFDEMQTGTTPSRHGRFTTDANGNYTGWFACVPVGNATQQTIGSDVYFYVQMNDGGSGTTLNRSFRTTSTIKLLNYSSTAGDANGCTPLLGTSTVADEKMVAIYDNTAGSGRPLYCTFTENNNNPDNGGQLNEGTLWNNPVLYPTVDGVSGSWAAIIPNTLSGGVKAINFINIQDAALVLSTPNTSADGIWNGVSTANPAGDSTKPIVINSIAGSALPVSLLSFRGESAKEGVRLFWETAQEVNNRQFEISRASGNGSFRTIGVVDAVAVPSAINRYQFVDPNPVSGMNYYQLKQLDVDGRSKTYKTIAIRVGDASNKMRVANSGSSDMLVNILVSKNKKGYILYTDMTGNILYNQSVSLREGDNLIRIPVAAAASRIAVVSFLSEAGERMNMKVLR